ncbi:hypothetical protein N480_00330 [Pseudoalteromonas luteoviolacea S2607]|uniref:phage integrase N-terminal SAM-like domain-containing protein n=1 Tax=Pseudoalteromonas luteoviolacea TaxID=43657 RepID=UPI0007B05D07|nr:phage integrase N-terminal SAM-like domain-containing protein [Pseudoalteromonas luteoviolacea]KZN39307.1 hypothetical protein N480_00330 [Pseudoalteromonas luteoviolacea S2607]
MPKALGEEAVGQYLSHLANQQNLTAITQAQPLNALLYMYKEIIKRPLSLEFKINNSGRYQKLPVVLTEQEIATLLTHFPHQHLLLLCCQCSILSNYFHRFTPKAARVSAPRPLGDAAFAC